MAIAEKDGGEATNEHKLRQLRGWGALKVHKKI